MPAIETGGLALLLVAVAGYLIGSIPFGVLVTKVMGLGDLRKIGSGNIGATNVLRTGNRAAALATLVLDGGKGALAVLAARYFLAEDAAQMAGFTAFLGHLFPVWLGFRGGKGVATFLGTLLALAFPVGLAACLIWLAVAVYSRISSLSALIAAAASPVMTVILEREETVVLTGVLMLFVLWRHRANIERLRRGTEPRIGQ